MHIPPHQPYHDELQPQTVSQRKSFLACLAFDPTQRKRHSCAFLGLWDEFVGGIWKKLGTLGWKSLKMLWVELKGPFELGVRET